MKMIEVTKSCPFSPNGYDVVEYLPGEQEVSDAVAKVALAEKWAKKVKAAPPENKNAGAAPENKSADGESSGDVTSETPAAAVE